MQCRLKARATVHSHAFGEGLTSSTSLFSPMDDEKLSYNNAFWEAGLP